MKTRKFVVEVERHGHRSQRLVPARDAHTAAQNCAAEGTVVLSCVPYTGQRIDDDHQDSIIRGCLEANKKKWGR